MARKKIGKGAGHQDTDDMSRTEVKAYHAEINEFYEEHGWRTTLSHFLLSPAQAGKIVAKTRARMEKEKAEEKAAKAKARAAGKKAKKAPKKPAKKKAPKAAKPKAKKAPKKPAKKKAPPRKAPKKAAAKAPAKAPAKRGRPRKTAVAPAAGAEETLDYLLAYRSKKGNEAVSLDTVIADLTTQVRAA